VAAEPELSRRLRAGASAFFGFVGEHRAAWWALLSGHDAPVTVAFAAARERQARLVAGLVEQGAREAGDPVDPEVAEAVAHAVNGARGARPVVGVAPSPHPESSPTSSSTSSALGCWLGLTSANRRWWPLEVRGSR
jgi:hypothetical protein